MKNKILRSLLLALLVSVLSVSVVLAHGTPIITAEPTVAVPGGQITITGKDMVAGESFKLTLEGMAGVVQLGEATAEKNGVGAGFIATFTLPSDLTPGSYFVSCTAEDGDSTSADLTIVASSEQMNTQGMEASTKPLLLDRSKPPLLIGSVLVLALLSAGLGVWLIRMRE
jgi:uncharacterized Zn-binding protein involved in type VI secretion